MTLGAFGGVAGFFALFFFSDVPRVRNDIVTVWSNSKVLGGGVGADLYQQKIPIIGPHFVREIHPADNVCSTAPSLIIYNCDFLPARNGMDGQGYFDDTGRGRFVQHTGRGELQA